MPRFMKTNHVYVRPKNLIRVSWNNIARNFSFDYLDTKFYDQIFTEIFKAKTWMK